MIFWASCEADMDVALAQTKVRKCVEPFLNEAFADSSLAAIDGKLRYVPIIMPEGTRERYPERSKLQKKERVYDCAPQLDHDVFVTGTFEEQLREYLRGIALSAPHLAGLGATETQIEDFKKIVAIAADRILTEQAQFRTLH